MSKHWLRWAAAAAAALLVAGAALQFSGFLPDFKTETVDRSGPAVLLAVRDLSRYHAAAGDYQVVIDIEKDVSYVPDVIAGSRTLFVAAGTIDAYVDFSTIAEDALVIDQEARTVELRLPEPALDKPNIDNSRSYVFSQERGLWDKFNAIVGAPQDQREFYLAAEKRITEAAGSSGLLDRAKRNTESMLTGLLAALGYQTIIRQQGA